MSTLTKSAGRAWVVPIAFSVAIVVLHTQGVFSMLGVPTSVPRFVGELLIIAAGVYTLRITGLRVLVSDRALAAVTVLFVVASLISLAASEDTMLGFVLFMRLFAITFLAFLVLPHVQLRNPTSWAPAAVFEVLFVIQIVVSLSKLALRGPSESIIGTISLRAGELSVTYPLIILALILPLFRRSSSQIATVYVVIILISTFVMAIAGDKRAYIFVFFMILFAYTLLSFKDFNTKSRSSLRNFVLTAVLLILVGGTLSVIVVKFSPSLNPEQSRWGTFSPGYVNEYVRGYVFRESSVDYWTSKTVDPESGEAAPDSIPLGRFATFNSHLQLMANDEKLFFGYGPGVATLSSFRHTIQDVRRRFDFGWTLTGLNTLLLQVGFVGAIGFVGLFGIVGWRGIRLSRNSNSALSLLGISVSLIVAVVMFDLFAYGITTIGSGIIFPVFAYFVVSALKGRTCDVPFIRWMNMPGENIRQKMTAGYIRPFVAK